LAGLLFFWEGLGAPANFNFLVGMV